MNKKVWLYLFLVALLLNLAAIGFSNEPLRYISKPLIIIFLFIYFIVTTKPVRNPFKRYILLALIFSWLGDVLLMDVPGLHSFILGLLSFLIAHLFYILFFYRVRGEEAVSIKFWPFIPTIAYCISFIIFLWPYLGLMLSHVIIYSITISVMFSLALHMLYLQNRKAGALMMWGALLFVISDSVLATNMFYSRFEGADIIIMLTYGLAQLLIIEGAVKYLTSASKQ